MECDEPEWMDACGEDGKWSPWEYEQGKEPPGAELRANGRQISGGWTMEWMCEVSSMLVPALPLCMGIKGRWSEILR